jgi:gamma-glutamyltranspeptidase
VIAGLIARGHERVLPPTGVKHRTFMGGGQAIMIDPVTGALAGASDVRKDGIAIGY